MPPTAAQGWPLGCEQERIRTPGSRVPVQPPVLQTRRGCVEGPISNNRGPTGSSDNLWEAHILPDFSDNFSTLPSPLLKLGPRHHVPRSKWAASCNGRRYDNNGCGLHSEFWVLEPLLGPLHHGTGWLLWRQDSAGLPSDYTTMPDWIACIAVRTHHVIKDAANQRPPYRCCITPGLAGGRSKKESWVHFWNFVLLCATLPAASGGIFLLSGPAHAGLPPACS